MSKVNSNVKFVDTNLGNCISFKPKDTVYGTLSIAVDDIKALSLLPKVAYTGVYNIGVPNPYEEHSKQYYVVYQLIAKRDASIKDEQGNDLSYADTEQFVNDNSDLAICVNLDTFMELAKNLSDLKLFKEDSKISIG